ncbi:cytochrome P450 [Mycolicibacterium sphagni]|nr:cytochrome P450 [Mycolicibacterium sphagni]
MTTSENTRTCPVSPEVAQAAAAFHLFDPEMDPHALLGTFREQCPVARSEQLDGFWVVTRHADIQHVLKNPETFSSGHGNSIPPVFDPIGTWIPLHFDPPEHGKFRRDLNANFLPQKVASMEDDIRAQARKYLNAIVERGHGELVWEVCVPYPSMTFLVMLGAPVEDVETLLNWKNMNMIGMSGDPDAEEYVDEFIRPEYMAYFNALLDERVNSDNPPDDILTALTRANYGDRPFTRDEMLRVCTTLMIAGLDTVTAALTWTFHFLATNPGHRQQLIDDRSLIPSAVEELNRYFGIVSVARRATQDAVVGEQAIKQGDWVLCTLPSAGRDAAEFPDAETVDFHRSPNRHIGFGTGPHRCLGIHLARLEMRVLLEEMVKIMPHFELAPGCKPGFQNGIVISIDDLEIVVTDGS